MVKEARGRLWNQYFRMGYERIQHKHKATPGSGNAMEVHCKERFVEQMDAFIS